MASALQDMGHRVPARLHGAHEHVPRDAGLVRDRGHGRAHGRVVNDLVGELGDLVVFGLNEISRVLCG